MIKEKKLNDFLPNKNGSYYKKFEFQDEVSLISNEKIIECIKTVMDPETRQLVRLSISSTDNANAMMDLLLSKKNAPARKEWLEKKGSLVRI